MRDREMVAAIVSGDPGGLAAAYDSYADALHVYCRSLLAEPADAADAVQDTFIIAAAKLGGLRDPDRLRPWLYAVARNECHRRLRRRARQASLDEAGEVSDTAADGPGADVARAELRELIRAAVAGLNPGEREVIELTLRHELEGADLAAALGVPLNQAHALASRARAQLERSLGALLVARTGRRSCPELAAILAGWDGQLSVLLRKRVSRHIERCNTCTERKRRELSPAMLSALPVVLLPPGLREQVLQLAADIAAEAVRYREMVAGRAEPFRSDSGFPVPLRLAVPRRPRRRLAAYAAAAALIVLAGGATAAALMLRQSSAPVTAAARAAVTAGRSPAGRSSTATSAAAAPSVTATASGSSPGSPGTSATAAPSASGSGSTAPSPPPSPPATRSPNPTSSSTPPGTSAVSPTSVTLTEPPLGGPYGGAFTITASGGPVTYSISVPAAEASYLTVQPASGTLAAGQQVTVTVSIPAGSPSAFYYNTVTVNPGAVTVAIYYPPAG